MDAPTQKTIKLTSRKIAAFGVLFVDSRFQYKYLQVIRELVRQGLK
jgi:hypothetical protein